MSSGERTRVMIVDDHSIVRDGLKQILEQTGEFEVVGQSVDGEGAVRLAAELSPDMVLMDVILPQMDGVAACREITAANPEIRVVILTASTKEDTVVEAVAAGAAGFLLKETDRDSLLSTMRGVAAGELRIPAAAVRKAIAAIGASTKPGMAGATARLTRREREILSSFAAGMSYAQIGEARGIRPVTVRNAVYGIQSKLGIDTMQELVLWAARNGLLNAQ